MNSGNRSSGSSRCKTSYFEDNKSVEKGRDSKSSEMVSNKNSKGSKDSQDRTSGDNTSSKDS
jgi:hypothetical protein